MGFLSVFFFFSYHCDKMPWKKATCRRKYLFWIMVPVIVHYQKGVIEAGAWGAVPTPSIIKNRKQWTHPGAQLRLSIVFGPA